MKKNEPIIDFKYRYKAGDEYREFESSAFKLATDKPKFCIIANDITERKIAEQKLKESEEKFRTITESSIMGISIAQDNQLTYANQKAADILGYSINEMNSWTLKDILNHIHPEDIGLVMENMKKVLQNTEDALNQLEYRALKKNGEVIWTNNYGVRIEIDGKPAQLIISIDITEKKEAEQKLRQSEARLRTIMESIPFDFFVFDNEGKYVMQNARCRENWGNIIGMTPKEVNPNLESNTLDLWEKNNLKAFSGETVEDEVLFKVKGKERFFHNIIAPIYDDNQIQGILGINIDITERKIAEQN